MRIETLKADAAVHVHTVNESIELGLGDATKSGQRVTLLSVPQAEMLMHALGIRIAQLRERQRRVAEQQAHISEVLLDTEIRLHDH